MIPIQEIDERGKEILRLLGLDIFEHMEFYLQHDVADYCIKLGLGTNIILDTYTNGDARDAAFRALLKKSEEIEESILNSDIVSSRIKTLEGKIQNLQEENEELKKYKTYYDLAKGLK